MRKVLTALSVVGLVTLGCGQTKSVILGDVTAVRSSDDLVTVRVTVLSNGHLALDDEDEFCVEARFSQPAVADGGGAVDAGSVDAGSADAGSADAGVGLEPGTLVEALSGCSTKAKGFIIELKSTKAIPRPAVLVVSVSKGFALGRMEEARRVLASP
ncbi:MAG: hypothetical protein SFW67_20865 [Myxococcaceae bacterium]|nr:hypothetical protein [Myxococcaceae bacterium]